VNEKQAEYLQDILSYNEADNSRVLVPAGRIAVSAPARPDLDLAIAFQVAAELCPDEAEAYSSWQSGITLIGTRIACHG
jgi:hypothetical protein